jgi:hypothetical protein
MAVQFRAQRVVTGTLALLLAATAMVAVARAQNPALPLALDSARVTLAGTSNIHDFTASTTTVQLQSAHLAQPAAAWDAILTPGAVDVFEVAVPSTSLKSDRTGWTRTCTRRSSPTSTRTSSSGSRSSSLAPTAR